MNIGDKIKKLRQENNLTQEELAEQLGVSFQAVSRWENYITFPDITMLPRLANMFDVTVDYLLDVDIYKKEKEIEEILNKDEILDNQGKTIERKELLEEALKKYPNSWKIKSSLETVYFTLSISYGDKESEEKAIKVANEILDKCTDDQIRYGSMQTLIFIYSNRKEIEKASKIVSKLPGMMITSEWLRPDVVTGEARIRATQVIFSSLVEMFYNKITTTFGREEIGKRDIQLLKYKDFLDIVYEDGDYGFQNIRLYEVYMLCAKDQATIKNKEKTLDYLYKSVESLKKWFDIYRNKRKMRHTSFLVDRLTIDPTTWSFSNDPICQKEELIKEIKKEVFDFIKEEEKYQEIMETISSLYK